MDKNHIQFSSIERRIYIDLDLFGSNENSGFATFLKALNYHYIKHTSMPSTS